MDEKSELQENNYLTKWIPNQLMNIGEVDTFSWLHITIL